MLKQIRGSLDSLWVTALLGILIAAFAVWGIGDIFRGGGGNAVATIGDRDITPNELSRAFDQNLAQMEAQFGQPLERSLAIALGVHRRALNDLIGSTTFEVEAVDLGLRATDRQVAADIRAIDALRGPGGLFDPLAYDRILYNMQMTKKQFEQSVRDDIARGQLLSAVTANTTVTNLMTDTLYRYRKEKRTAKILSLKGSDITSLPVADDEALSAYQAENGSRFMVPEYRGVSYLVLSAVDFMDEVTVTEDEIAQLYETRASEYKTPEKRDLEVANFDDEATASLVVERVAAGEAFAAVAADLTSLSVNDILLGTQTRADIDLDYGPEIAEAVFALESGSLSAPLDTGFGFALFRVESITEGAEQTLEEVRAELDKDLSVDKATDALYEFTALVEDEIAGGASIADIAANLQVPYQTIDKVSKDGLRPDGKLADRTPSVLPYLADAFQMEVGDELELNESATGNFYVIAVDSIEAQATRPLADVEEAVRAAWMDAERARLVNEQAETALDRLHAGESIEVVAQTLGGSVVTTPVLTRDTVGRTGDVSRALGTLIFDMEIGSHEKTAASDGDGFVIAELLSVTEGEPYVDSAARDAAKSVLEGELLNDVFTAYQLALQEKHGVTVNDSRVDALFNPQTPQAAP